MNMEPTTVDLIIKSAIGAAGTLLGSIFLFLVKFYFTKIKEALEALDLKINENQRKSEKAYNKVTERLRSIEVNQAKISTTIESIIKDVSRIEGGQEILQQNVSEMATRVERASGRIEAAFRFIDNAHQRATDIKEAKG